MVYPDLTGGASRIAATLRVMRTAAATFNGSRSFAYWHVALAYALLPADPTLTVTGRRRVRRGSSGRWVVTQTFVGPRGCPNPWHGSAPARASQRCPECPR
jgi:hypothetical protein